MDKKGWMIRAGEGGRLFEDFEKGYIAVGWGALGDISKITTIEQFWEAYPKAFPLAKKGELPNQISMIHKFRNVIKIGDLVVTYDPESRNYLVGEVTGEYEYRPNLVGDYPQVRKVNWLGKVSRDQLPQKARNSLGATLTLFALKDFVIHGFLAVLNGESKTPAELEVLDIEEIDNEEIPSSRQDTVNQSKELIKDKIVSLDPDQMEQLMAAVLRGMGFRARVSPKGPDRGIDIIASPDGLGLQEPRIKVEVKHRGGTIGSQALRSFIGALRPGDRGIFLSTGGFTREARYEAERSNIPVTLVDIDTLAELIVDYYEDFDLDGKALIPLVRIYWPAE
jgi:restriction system protein